VIDEYREQITAADRVLLAAVNERIELVRALHEYKQAEGLPLRDPAREDDLIRQMQVENSGPLSDSGVADLFHYLLTLTRKEIHGD
jgi:chorismate mutase